MSASSRAALERAGGGVVFGHGAARLGGARQRLEREQREPHVELAARVFDQPGELALGRRDRRVRHVVDQADRERAPAAIGEPAAARAAFARRGRSAVGAGRSIVSGHRAAYSAARRAPAAASA